MANQVICVRKKPPPPPPTKAKSHAISRKDEQTGQYYWAKGTGFGTGSTSTQWDLEQVRNCHLLIVYRSVLLCL